MEASMTPLHAGVESGTPVNWQDASILKSFFSLCKRNTAVARKSWISDGRFLQYRRAELQDEVDDVKLFGDALWYTYD